MLYIRTGKPGHGKTLNTLREVDQSAKDQDRVVYYSNINGLKPEQMQAKWYSFDDPEQWFHLPPDSIIVVDEAQGWFASRDPRARPPEHITRFETMRHQGHEVHLVTQDPRYLDVHLRRLCNGHIHYWRVFKSQQLIRFESEVVVEKVEVKSSFKDADKKTLRLDKRYFGAYTSTNGKHHFKARIPTKFILAILVVAVAGVMAYRVYERYEEGKQTEAEQVAQDQSSGGVVDQVKSTVGAFINPVAGSGEASKPQTVEGYLKQRVPRVAGVPSSAPIYDPLTQPASHPRLYCMSSTDPNIYARSFTRMSSAVVNGNPTVCQCYTQQGSRVATEFRFCMNIVENGYFDPSIPDRAPTQQYDQQPAQQPYGPNQDNYPGQQPQQAITVVGSEKERFLW
ncbi:Zonular occludens toxin [Pseudomonas marincola]|uniref:Zonular occludens toxin n=1 Tax=Pseudomonas marincola TaxID=437900 RepID=A0A653E351_9PSED|nr:zonular occludens toxin domain-containing protein [Pseudomonas marincola]CAE6888970.1 Zonular occludens toxin [Pseudomonas marincola]